MGPAQTGYPIREYVTGEPSRRSFTEGFYVLMHFSLSAAKVIDVERTLKLTDTILRYLITVVEQKGSSSAPVAEVAEEVEAVEPVGESDEG